MQSFGLLRESKLIIATRSFWFHRSDYTMSSSWSWSRIRHVVGWSKLGAAEGNNFRPGWGCFSHGSADCQLSSYFRCWNLVESETMWRRAPDKGWPWITVESWYEECRNCGVDNLIGGGCRAEVAMASFERASSKPGRGSCWLLEDYGRCFREWRKESDGSGWFTLRLAWFGFDQWVARPQSLKKRGLERTTPQIYFLNY